MSKLGANNQEVLTKLYILKFGRIFQRKKGKTWEYKFVERRVKKMETGRKREPER